MKENSTTTQLKEWPGAFALYKISRDCVRKNLGVLLLVVLFLGAIEFAATFILSTIFRGAAAVTVKQFVMVLLGAYISVVTVNAYLLAARHKRVDFDSVTIISSSLFWRMLLLNLLTGISVVGGLILLIVPGIIIAMRLSIAQYYLVDQNMGVLEAYKASWHATKGHLGKLWGIFGVCVLMLLPVFTIIGIIATVYLFFMYSAARTLFYLYISKLSQNKA